MVPQPLAKTSVENEVLELTFCECLTQFAQNAQQQALHTDVVNDIFCECHRQFAHFSDQGLSTKSSRAAGFEEEACMSRFVLILIFLSFLIENCPNQTTHFHTTGGAAGHQAAQPQGQSSS